MITPLPDTATNIITRSSLPIATEATSTAHPPNLTATITPSPYPTSTTTPTTLACWQAGGRVEKAALKTDLLRQPLEYSVYLPPCYDQESRRRYPVLYLIHGQSFTDDQWIRLGAGETADRLIAAGEIPPLMIVMPRDRIWEQPTGDKFGEVVVDQLIPFIDQTYRTRAERQYRAIGGLSRGAGWAVHLGLSRWELFGAIGGHSLPVFWTDTAHIAAWLDAIPPESLPRIYLDIGNKDRPPILSSAIWFEELLTRMDIPHEWYLFDGYHDEAYWRAHVEQYLRWYTQGW
jgi:enterochelin esterase-like enzyme